MTTSLIYYQEQVLKATPRPPLRLEFSITGAKAVSPVVQNSFVLTTFDALSTQAQIDTHLGTTNEFLLAAFDATAMGTDAFAAIINMGGQAAKVTGVHTATYTGTNGATETLSVVNASATMTSSSLTTQVARGANGNIAVRTIIVGLDAFTSGRLVLQVSWIPA